MRYLNQLNKQINTKHACISHQRKKIHLLYKEALTESTTKGMLVIALPAFIIGFLAERATHKHSVIRKGAHLGASATLKELIHSLHFLSGFSAIFVYTQIKKRLIG